MIRALLILPVQMMNISAFSDNGWSKMAATSKTVVAPHAGAWIEIAIDTFALLQIETL